MDATQALCLQGEGGSIVVYCEFSSFPKPDCEFHNGLQAISPKVNPVLQKGHKSKVILEWPE